MQNKNRSSHMARGKFYVCPICGNIIHSTGETLICCCGVTLPPLEAEQQDAEHAIRVAVIEDEYHVTLDHPMTKTHYISFLAATSDQGVQLEKLYPEGGVQARFKINRVKFIYAYCNRHGLFRIRP